MKFKRNHVDTTAERNFLTALIIDNNFYPDIAPLLKLEYLKSDSSKTITKWCINYYDKYQKAPNQNIKIIFDAEKSNIKPAESELIETFLEKLSDDYVDQQGVNKQYILQQTIKYFKERSLELLLDKCQGLVMNGKAEQAENEILNYHKVEKVTSNWVRPLSDEAVLKFFRNTDDNTLFSFPGALGKLVGSFQREWLVGFMGPPKRGKTVWLWELALQALLNKYKVAMFSLEMGEQVSNKRLYKRITALTEKAEESFFAYPVFDCVYNQDGSCGKKQRNKNNPVVREENTLIDYDPDLNYEVCTYCRDHEKLNYKYDSSVWWETIKRKPLNIKNVREKTKKFRQVYQDNLVFKAYPAFSANLAAIKSDLAILEQAEDFIPDVIIIDYADILAPDISGFSERGTIDVTWKNLKRLASERKCMVVTASQSNRNSITKKSVSQVDAAEDIRKINHVDCMFSINQTPEEKKRGITRIGAIALRDGDFNEFKQVTVLQQPEVGQTFLDCDWYYEENE